MHITLVSQCEKRALKRTRALIDRYAIRISERSWVTPITMEALDDLRLALRRTATRQSAIACYINKGKQAMKLAWTIGRADAFGADGALAVGTKQRPRAAPPPWLRNAALVAKVAGLAHDLGKGSAHFQDKLTQAIANPSAAPIKDETRHEWVSMKLYQAMREPDNEEWRWTEAWTRVGQDKNKRRMPFGEGENAIASVFDAVDFAVLTHHGLLAPRMAGKNSPCPSQAENGEHTERVDKQGKKWGEKTVFSPANAMLCDEVLHELAKEHARLKSIDEDHRADTLAERIPYWRAVALIARAALILADHEISAQDRRSTETHGKSKVLTKALAKTLAGDVLLANTLDHQPNQTLDWHLKQVAARAQERIHLFHDPMLPGLSRQTIDTILLPSAVAHFQWQDEAVRHFAAMREASFQPTLIFNLAGTGAGKTRMNVKALAALRNEDDPLRIAAGFNLRTLTLQTHRAFQRQLGMGDEEAACVIGDRFVRSMYEQDGNTDEDEESAIEYETSADYPQDYPAWIMDMAVKHPELINLVGAPVLVATMDYLVNAGDPSKQGHHAHALLRIASSDLILDEVDSYEPDALIAVLRVVQMAGLFGRHVIASSATLCEPVAQALFKAFQSGVSMFATLRKKPIQPRVSLIDNQCLPSSFSAQSSEQFTREYQNRLHALIVKTRQQPVFRLNQFYPIPVPKNKEQGFTALLATTKQAIEQMHANQNWTYAQSGKRVSFGLVRVAQVKTCVALAQALNRDYPHVHVTAYHSVDLRLRRMRKEQALDRLFNRNPDDGNDGNNALLSDPDIQRRIQATAGDDVVFIVVATPVEEIGRDHDFDWAIIEPSSVQSIVQLAGRVNRHRLLPVTLPNIAILQYNLRALRGEQRVFQRPGNEIGDIIYTQDVIELLGADTRQIDAALRFGDGNTKCLFAQKDDESIATRLKAPLKAILADQNTPLLAWATRCHYERYPLREASIKRTFRIQQNEADRIIVQEQSAQAGHSPVWQETSYVKRRDEKPVKPYWLAQGIAELLIEADELPERSLAISAMMFETFDCDNVVFDDWLGGY